MAKLPSLKHVKYVRAKGKVYAYFNTGKLRAGKPVFVPLPSPNTVGFFDAYASMKGARSKREAPIYTIAEMAKEYERSPQFAARAKGTQILYGKTLRRIVELLGKFPVDALERRHIQTVLDKEMSGPGAHNIFLAVLSVLYKWGRAREKTELEPTKEIERLKGGEHAPWPEAVVEAALQSDDAVIRLSVHLLYFVGQRIGDTVRMGWRDIEGGLIHVVQQKTGKELWIHLLEELKAELARTPKRGMTILADEAGRPFKEEVIRRRLKAFTASHGVERVPHGLRKNAVEAFLYAGSTIPEVSAITGQTYAVVEHYAKKISQKRMAKAAVIKLENKRRTRKHFGKPN